MCTSFGEECRPCRQTMKKMKMIYAAKSLVSLTLKRKYKKLMLNEIWGEFDPNTWLNLKWLVWMTLLLQLLLNPNNRSKKIMLNRSWVFFDPNISLRVISDPITSFRVFGCIGIQGTMGQRKRFNRLKNNDALWFLGPKKTPGPLIKVKKGSGGGKVRHRRTVSVVLALIPSVSCGLLGNGISLGILRTAYFLKTPVSYN